MSLASPHLSAARSRTAPVAITGGAIHIPGAPARSPWAVDDAVVPAERAHELLGRKGLLAKDEATRLALCAVHRALGRPVRAPRPDGPPDPRTAVVACSNLGNLEAVIRIARAARSGGVKAVSALDAPNASSNVVASTVAIWFRFGGPNLMVCSGATAGLDGVALGSLLLRAGRADRAVVVGSEPADAVASAARRPRTAISGAAAVVLEPAREGDCALAPPMLGRVRFSRASAPHEATAMIPRSAWLVLAPGALPGRADLAAPGREVVDLEAELGDLYGAAGVVQVAAAAQAAARTAGTVAVICGDRDDGWQATTIGTPELRQADGTPRQQALGA